MRAPASRAGDRASAAVRIGLAVAGALAAAAWAAAVLSGGESVLPPAFDAVAAHPAALAVVAASTAGL
ncbi:hypothetical protein [Geodermatophilus sp. SYSU D01105]